VFTALDTLRAIADVELEKLDENKDLEVFNIAEL
jgi:carbamoyl-phosphate synthase large subunit